MALATVRLHMREGMDGRVMSWLADNVTASVFFNASGQPDAFQPWVKLFNGPPQQFAQTPAGPIPGNQSIGIVGIYQITLNAQPGRMDIILAPATSVGPQPATISDIESAVTTIVGYVTKLVSNTETLRLALGLNLSKPVKDPVETTAEFIRQTRLQVRPDATDLSFSINVPTDVGAERIRINRICRWGSGQLQTLTFNMSGFSGVQVPVVETFYASTLQLDINTAPPNAGKPISIMSPQTVLRAMADEAIRMKDDAYTYIVMNG